ncbi:MAG: spore germination protein, partial [Clostridia bacterium]|nr:spore germination protein [Clostridia bacterium]
MKFKNFFMYKHKNSSNKVTLTETPELPESNPGINNYIKNNITDKSSFTYKSGTVSSDISENLAFIKDAFEYGKNFDFIIREFKVKLENSFVDAFLIFFDGLTNKEFVNRDILNPLMIRGLDAAPEDKDLEDLIYRCMLSQAPNSKLREMQTIIELVGFGNCAVFVNGCSCAFVADIKGWNTRSVGKPISEAVLSGPQEAFCETVMTNIALVRKI